VSIKVSPKETFQDSTVGCVNRIDTNPGLGHLAVCGRTQGFPGRQSDRDWIGEFRLDL
jgi:hypothetical protein